MPKKLYFENSYGQRRVIGEPKDDQETWDMIKTFCEERNYKIPYVRMWTTPDGKKWHDVGSHTEYFIEVEEETEQIKDILEG